jgi:hypothetical protein
MANEQNLKPFKKGKDERRNETGRPKKLPPIKELIEKTLGEEKNGISGVDAIFKVLLSKAVKGDLKASQMLLDYYYGKATQKTEIVGEIQTTNKPIDLKKLSLEELKELERIAERLDSDKGSDSE